MQTLAAIVKEFLLPGSAWFLLIGMTAGVLLLAGSPGLRLWGRRWLILLSTAYWLLALPFVAIRSAAALSPRSEATHGAEAGGDQAVVVLGNGIFRYKVGELELNTLTDESAYTVLESVRLYRALGAPLMIVSGGVSHPEVSGTTEAAVLREALIAQGVSLNRIVLEGRSLTTRDQAMYIGPIIRQLGIKQFALVTSPVHMTRALAIFRSQDLAPIPAPSAYGSEATARLDSPLRPSAAAWMLSERAAYETIGLFYYWLRGWLLPGPSPKDR